MTQLCERGIGIAQAAKQTKKSDVANQEVNQQINRAAMVLRRQPSHAKSKRQRIQFQQDKEPNFNKAKS